MVMFHHPLQSAPRPQLAPPDPHQFGLVHHRRSDPHLLALPLLLSHLHPFDLLPAFEARVGRLLVKNHQELRALHQLSIHLKRQLDQWKKVVHLHKKGAPVNDYF